MISIEASTRTCKVDTASATRIESDRFLNPANAVCPRWTGRDLSGRQVNADSFYTKSAGCNSAQDRVVVENTLRPQYSEYINLDVNEGIRGQLYENNMYYQNAGTHSKQMRESEEQAGHFGGVFSGAARQVSCSYNGYEDGVNQMERQVALNNKRNNHGCRSRHEHKQHNHHEKNVVEGYTDERMVAPNNFARKNAAAISGYRSCRFTEASGF